MQSELREHEHAEDLVLERHRGEEHGLVEVFLGARDRVGPRVDRRVRQVLGDTMLSDPAGDALAELDHQLLGGLVDVLADLTLHGDRDQVLALEPVDPDVVVVDQLPKLGRDREADLADARQPRQADAELLDRLELGCPGRHLLEVLGVLDRHRRLGRERGHRVELVVGPVVGRVVVDVE